MKVVLNYDHNTGQITDASGMIITTWAGLNYEEYNSQSTGISPEIFEKEAIKFAKLGYSKEDLLELREKGII